MINWKELEGKNFKFILATGKIYTGKIIDAEFRKDYYFISIKTIFQEEIGFTSKEIINYNEVLK